MKKKVLDITSFDCPMTFIKAKEFIKSNTDDQKIIIIRGKTNLQKLENSLKKNFRYLPLIFPFTLFNMLFMIWNYFL